MAKITVVGAGITGLAIASILAQKKHEITVLARDLPTDGMDLDRTSVEWASPWAGAFYIPDVDAEPRDRQMQLDAFAALWELAETHPETSVRKIELHDVRDDGVAIERVWYREHMPEFRVMSKEELPEGCSLGMVYTTVVVTPTVFLPWLRNRLEASGVKFVRKRLESLDELKGAGHDVLVNATGWGAKFLGNVMDQSVQQVRGQTHLVRTWYDKIFIRQGNQYTYCIPRLDGTAILGGVKGVGDTDPTVDEAMRLDIYNRVSDNLPHVFACFPADFDLVRDNVGIRPGREGGVRAEKEIIDGQKVVHAYGVGGTGYVYSFGLAKFVGDLVDEFTSSSPKAKL